MQFADIKFEPLYDGVQAMVPIGPYELSIVKHKMSYGGKMGLYEIAVMKDKEQIELRGITEPNDTVKGFLKEDDVLKIIDQMKGIDYA
jgi:hypothetical protein